MSKDSWFLAYTTLPTEEDDLLPRLANLEVISDMELEFAGTGQKKLSMNLNEGLSIATFDDRMVSIQ